MLYVINLLINNLFMRIIIYHYNNLIIYWPNINFKYFTLERCFQKK